MENLDALKEMFFYAEKEYHKEIKKFIVKGPSLITFKICRNLSLNTLLSGVFIDRLEEKILTKRK